MKIMSFEKALTSIIFAILILACSAFAAELDCKLQSEFWNTAQLLQEREDALIDIAARVAKFIEVPYLPDDSENFLNNTVGALLKVIAVEKRFREGKYPEKKTKMAEFANFVRELKDIQKEVIDFEFDILKYGEFSLVDISHYISAIRLYLQDSEYKNTLKGLITRISDTQGRSKFLFIPRCAHHACLVVGVSTVKYKYIHASPLFFTHTSKLRSWAPKFGVALGAGENGFQLTDSFIDSNGSIALLFHPDHPLAQDKKKVTTFNWEGSIIFLEGAVNHQTFFGTGGLSVLPLGFSIGPEFIPSIKLDKYSKLHDTWKFYALLGIQKTLSFE